MDRLENVRHESRVQRFLRDGNHACDVHERFRFSELTESSEPVARAFTR